MGPKGAACTMTLSSWRMEGQTGVREGPSKVSTSGTDFSSHQQHGAHWGGVPEDAITIS